MVPVSYLNAIRNILDHYENTQLDTVEKAADVVIESITNGGMVYTAAIGHSNEADFLNRAGGLAVVQAFSYGFNVNAPVPKCKQNRERPEAFEVDLETVRFALKASNIRAGDVMVIGSVSGKSRYPVELAMACQEMKIKVIGFTSLEYTAQVESMHPSGKKLCDVCDVVLDNGAPYGDAAVEIPGIEDKKCPVSGASMVVCGWLIWGRVMEKMAAAGNAPTSFISINREGGKESYDKAIAQYNERGY